MANQYTIYTSADASAPVLAAATAGSIIGVLDACLVNGYGSKVAAGWAKAFTGTNLAAYRAPSGVRHYFRIDNNTVAGTGCWAIQGYESMTDVNTGTHPVTPSGLTIMAGNANPATWVMAADALTFNLFILNSGTYYCTTFGEFYSLVANDSYRTLMRGGNPSAVLGSAANDGGGYLGVNSSNYINYSNIDRGHTGVGNAVTICAFGNAAMGGLNDSMSGVVPYPNPADGGLYLSPVWLSDYTTVPSGGIRGRQRGFWHFLHPVASVNDRDTVSGTGDLAGRSFLFIKPSPVQVQAGVYVIETSATLESN